MPSIQTQFIKFHETIKLVNLDENRVLKQKRDLLLDKLRKGLKQRFKGERVPTFEHRNQGSYRMGTGIKPTGGRDYDIDVALLFNVDPQQLGPVQVKQWVHEILGAHPHEAEIKRPCVTVQYTEGGEDAYHVDFAVYASPADGRRVPLLAKGFPGSSTDKKFWEPSDFEGLIAAIDGRFDDADDRQQYRRVIRYLKRWKDTSFPASGEGAPKGIGLTCAAYLWFQPHSSIDKLSQKRTDDDLGALKELVGHMLSNFQETTAGPRLRTPLPAAPHDDPFNRMSDKQMQVFKKKLDAFHDALVSAASRRNVVEACRDLRPHLGDDFPIPDSKAIAAAAAAGPAVRSTGHYA